VDAMDTHADGDEGVPAPMKSPAVTPKRKKSHDSGDEACADSFRNGNKFSLSNIARRKLTPFKQSLSRNPKKIQNVTAVIFSLFDNKVLFCSRPAESASGLVEIFLCLGWK
jgi:hypothetical protein